MPAVAAGGHGHAWQVEQLAADVAAAACAVLVALVPEVGHFSRQL